LLRDISNLEEWPHSFRRLIYLQGKELSGLDFIFKSEILTLRFSYLYNSQHV